MADKTVINEEFFDAQSVEIAALTQKISDLELENGEITGRYSRKIDELKEFIEELNSEDEVRKKKLNELQSENGGLGAVAARASGFEARALRLHRDSGAVMAQMIAWDAVISDLKRDLKGVKEKGVKLDAVGKERDLLLDKVGKLERDESTLRGELEGKEKEILMLKNELEEREVDLQSNEVLEKLMSGVVKTVDQLSGNIIALETSLISNLKRDLEGAKEREKEKGLELDAVGKEMDLLLDNVGKLEGDESKLRGELEGKDEDILMLKNNIEEREVVLEGNKVPEKLRSGVVKTVEQLLDEKQRAITRFEAKNREVEEKGLVGGLKGWSGVPPLSCCCCHQGPALRALETLIQTCRLPRLIRRRSVAGRKLEV